MSQVIASECDEASFWSDRVIHIDDSDQSKTSVPLWDEESIPGTESGRVAKLHRLAGRSDNPIPT